MEFKNARRMAADGDSLSEAAGLTAKAIRAYLAVATGTSEVLIDRDRLSSVPGIGEAAMSGMADLLDVLDRIRFAPVGTDPGQVGDLVDQAEKLVRAAQAEWSK
jgi:hypothetical protein